MRRASFAIIVGFASLAGLAFLLTQTVVILQRVAHVSNVSGEVQIIPNDEETTKPLNPEKTLVQAGDKLITGPDGRLSLNWIDGTRIRMEPDTELTVAKCQVARGAEYSTFRLDLGKVWIRILRVLSQQDKFEIVTPTATAGVRGTTFSVEVTTDGTTEVQVYEGQVAIEAEQGDLAIAAHETAQLATAGYGAQVIEFTDDDSQRWEQQIAELGPYLEITSPATREEFEGNTVTVAGRCERDAELTVNDQVVRPKFNGRFTVDVPVPADAEYFTVHVVASDRRGHATEDWRRLARAMPGTAQSLEPATVSE